MIKAKLEGAEALEQVLRKLPERVARNVVVDVLKAGAQVVAREVRRRAPRRSGRLARSVTVRKATRRMLRRGRGLVVLGFRKPGGSVAHLVEEGHVIRNRKGGRVLGEVPPQPFLEPSMRAKQRAALAAMGRKAGPAIEKQARRLAARAGARRR